MPQAHKVLIHPTLTVGLTVSWHHKDFLVFGSNTASQWTNPLPPRLLLSQTLEHCQNAHGAAVGFYPNYTFGSFIP